MISSNRGAISLFGVPMKLGSENIVRKNVITQQEWSSIDIMCCSGTKVVENTISFNNGTKDYHSALGLWYSEHTSVYHNNFVDNVMHVYLEESQDNIWDDGYPSGGNYWSNYNVTDIYSGLHQDETGSDGIGDTCYMIDANNTDTFPLVLSYKGHNIAIVQIEIDRAVIGRGFIQKIDVQVSNIGSFPQTFILTAYANDTEIQTLTVVLVSENSTTVRFYMDTSTFAYGNYTISAYAWSVLGETDTLDNRLADISIYVGIPGDVASAYGQVDMKDVGIVAKAFGSIPRHPKWNPNADINCDGQVDMKDVGITVQHFGQTE